MKELILDITVKNDIRKLTGLSLVEKEFLSVIRYFNKGSQVCYASNTYFAEAFFITIRQCRRVITSLKTKGYINIRLSKKGTQNTIRTITTTDKTPVLRKTYNYKPSQTTPQEPYVDYKPRLKKIG